MNHQAGSSSSGNRATSHDPDEASPQDSATSSIEDAERPKDVTQFADNSRQYAAKVVTSEASSQGKALILGRAVGRQTRSSSAKSSAATHGTARTPARDSSQDSTSNQRATIAPDQAGMDRSTTDTNTQAEEVAIAGPSRKRTANLSAEAYAKRQKQSCDYKTVYIGYGPSTKKGDMPVAILKLLRTKDKKLKTARERSSVLSSEGVGFEGLKGICFTSQFYLDEDWPYYHQAPH